jgi:hypothetical protein
VRWALNSRSRSYGCIDSDNSTTVLFCAERYDLFWGANPVTKNPVSARSDESAVLPHGRDIDRGRSNLLRHLAGAKTVILTSYKRDGTPPTPLLQALAVPLTHRLARYKTLHYQVLPRSRNGELTNERS